MAKSAAAPPGYNFPRISTPASAIMPVRANANGRPQHNGGAVCVTLGDRSYLDRRLHRFGEVVAGMDVVLKIVQGDVVTAVRSPGPQGAGLPCRGQRVQVMLDSARRVYRPSGKKKLAEADW